MFYLIARLTRIQIVEKKSATFGLPDSRELTVALVGDHESICRYPSEQDDRYLHVSGLISKFAAVAMNECEEGSLFGDSSAVSTLASTLAGTTLAGEETKSQICTLISIHIPALADMKGRYDSVQAKPRLR